MLFHRNGGLEGVVPGSAQVVLVVNKTQSKMVVTF